MSVRGEDNMPQSVSVSAQTGAGINELKDAIGCRLSSARVDRWIELQGRDGRLRAHLFQLGVVSEERITATGSWELHVDLPLDVAQRLMHLPGVEGITMREQLLPQEATG